MISVSTFGKWAQEMFGLLVKLYCLFSPP